jgi:predicted  nucleic acid-binding Zn-ribbon protein
MSTPFTAIIRECHRMRVHLRELQAEIDRGPRVLKARQAKLESERQAHKDHHESITKFKLKQRDDEGTLKQTETRLAKLEDQLTKISVQKEYDAKQSEIRQAKEKRTELEDAILTTMGEIEERTNRIPEVEKRWSDAQAEFAQYQVDAKERLDRLIADQKYTREELAKQEALLPAKERTTYDYLVKAHGPDAMAPVKGRVCQGCRSGMTEQKWLELRDGQFTLCSSCGKMLYPAD